MPLLSPSPSASVLCSPSWVLARLRTSPFSKPCSASPKRVRLAPPPHSLESLDLNGLFYTLLLVANHEVPDGEVPSSARQETLEECALLSGLTCSVKAITQQFPDIRSISPASSLWSFPRIGAVVKELYGALELDRLAFCLDSPLAVLKGKQALKWLVKVLRAVTNSDLPAGLVYQVWKNPGRACVWETTRRATARVLAASYGLRRCLLVRLLAESNRRGPPPR